MPAINSINDFNIEKYKTIRTEALAILPKRTINAHVHTETFVSKEKKHLLKKSKYNGIIAKKGITDKQKVINEIFPNKKITRFAIPLPLTKIGVEPTFVNNLMKKRLKKSPGAILANKDENIQPLLKECTKEKINVNAMKFHPWQFNPTKNKKFKIKDYFDKNTLEYCEKYKLTLLLEIPFGWTNDSLRTLNEITTNYKIKVLVPHVGYNYLGFDMSFLEYQKRNKPSKKIENDLKKASSIENLFVDTALIINRPILKNALEYFGEDRIIWGDDFPYSFSQKISEWRFSTSKRAKDIFKLINGTFKSKTKWQYYFNIYQQIVELDEAVPNNFDKNKIINKMFFKNAKKIYNISKEQIK